MNIDNYRVIFLSRHLDKRHKSDDTTKWWLEWHEYKLDNNNVPVYGVYIICCPKRKLNLKTNCFDWLVHRSDLSYYLHEPFDFNLRSGIIIAK